MKLQTSMASSFEINCRDQEASVLEPLLFLVYMNDITHEIDSNKVVKIAIENGDLSEYYCPYDLNRDIDIEPPQIPTIKNHLFYYTWC